MRCLRKLVHPFWRSSPKQVVAQRDYPRMSRSRKLRIEALEPRAMLTAESFALVGMDLFLDDPQYDGIDGSGAAIAMIDFGFDQDSPFFGPDVAAPFGVSDRIIARYDFTDDTPNDVSGLSHHGTQTTSVAAAFDTSANPSSYRGIAPGAELVFYKVGAGQVGGELVDLESTVVEALEMLITEIRDNGLEVAAVSMSFSFLANGLFSDPNDPAITAHAISPHFDELHNQLGVPLITSAGNAYQTVALGDPERMRLPGAHPLAITVGSVDDGGADADDADLISYFSERHETMLTILAPGRNVLALDSNGDFSALGGTSLSTPIVSGAAALARQIVMEERGLVITPDEFRALIVETGTAVTDFERDDSDDGVPNSPAADVPNTGYTWPRLNIYEMANKLMAPKVWDVEIGGPSASHRFAMAGEFDSGDQLKTVPVGGANSVTIHFSESVSVNSQDLVLIQYDSAGNPTTRTPDNFDGYVEVPGSHTYTATWSFNSALDAARYEIVLDDVITDAWGNRLDGEWVNPDSVDDPDLGFIDQGDPFRSGDGFAGTADGGNPDGGAFTFRFTILPADFDRDNDVDGDDFLIWQTGFGMSSGATQSDGDSDGDGAVDGDDFLNWQAQFGFDFTVWPTGSQQSMMGGGSALSSGANSNHAALDAYFASLGLFDNHDATSVERFFSTISEELLAELALGILSLQNAP